MIVPRTIFGVHLDQWQYAILIINNISNFHFYTAIFRSRCVNNMYESDVEVVETKQDRNFRS